MASVVNQEYARLMRQGPRFQTREAATTKHVGLAIAYLLMLVFCAMGLFYGGSTMVLAIPLGALFVYAVYAEVSKFLRLRDGMGRFEQLAATGVPVEAYLVQANSALFQPGSMSLPCLVLFSFEDSIGHNEDYLTELADRTFALKETRQSDPDLARVAAFTTNERAYLDRRRLYPLSFTGGHRVYCADLWIDRVFLPKGYLTGRMLMCIAEPGSEGAIELLPPTAAQMAMQTRVSAAPPPPTATVAPPERVPLVVPGE